MFILNNNSYPSSVYARRHDPVVFCLLSRRLLDSTQVILSDHFLFFILAMMIILKRNFCHFLCDLHFSFHLFFITCCSGYSLTGSFMIGILTVLLFSFLVFRSVALVMIFSLTFDQPSTDNIFTTSHNSYSCHKLVSTLATF